VTTPEPTISTGTDATASKPPKNPVKASSENAKDDSKIKKSTSATSKVSTTETAIKPPANEEPVLRESNRKEPWAAGIMPIDSALPEDEGERNKKLTTLLKKLRNASSRVAKNREGSWSDVSRRKFNELKKQLFPKDYELPTEVKDPIHLVNAMLLRLIHGRPFNQLPPALLEGTGDTENVKNIQAPRAKYKSKNQATKTPTVIERLAAIRGEVALKTSPKQKKVVEHNTNIEKYYHWVFHTLDGEGAKEAIEQIVMAKAKALKARTNINIEAKEFLQTIAKMPIGQDVNDEKY
jgi:hypothetical protein